MSIQETFSKRQEEFATEIFESRNLVSSGQRATKSVELNPERRGEHEVFIINI